MVSGRELLVYYRVVEKRFISEESGRRAFRDPKIRNASAGVRHRALAFKQEQTLRTILLLTFQYLMTFAWYGHLKYRNVALWKVIASVGASLFLNTASRCRQPDWLVRINTAQLKTIQE